MTPAEIGPSAGDDPTPTGSQHDISAHRSVEAALQLLADELAERSAAGSSSRCARSEKASFSPAASPLSEEIRTAHTLD